MIDLLKPLLDQANLPRQTVAAGEVIIAGGEPTSILYCMEDGIARSPDGASYGPGDMPCLCEALALEHYVTPVDALEPCRLIVIRREALEHALAHGGRLVMPLSRSIAADITQRRMAG